MQIFKLKPKTRTAGLPKTGGREGRPAAGRPLRNFLPAILLASLVFLCGCQTATQSLFTAAGPGWHVQQGQALWRPQRGLPEFGGDLVLARDDAGHCLIQFDKTPMAILSAQTTTNRWLIKFPQSKLSFSGHGNVPLRFSWLYLPGGPRRKTAAETIAL